MRCSSPVPAAPGTYPGGNADTDAAAVVASVSIWFLAAAAALALSLSKEALSWINNTGISNDRVSELVISSDNNNVHIRRVSHCGEKTSQS